MGSLLRLTIILATCSVGPTTSASPVGAPSEDPKLQAQADEQAAEEALSNLDGLQGVDVEIQGGAARVSGIANDPGAVRNAEDLVRSVTGASTVQNDLELSSSFSDRVEGAATRLNSRLEALLSYLPLVPIAALVVLMAAVIAWLIGKWDWPFTKLSQNSFLRDISRRLVQAAVLLAGILVMLEFLDATALVGGVLGAAGVAGIAVGFAFKDLVENYIASILLSIRQPFRPRDHVVIDGHEGLVTSMNSRSTVLTTFDGNIVRIPNAVVFKTTLINYSADTRRRFSFDVGVGYDVDLALAIEVGVSVLEQIDGVLTDPGPFAIVTQLGDSSISVRLFGWVDQSRSDFGRVRSVAMQRVKTEYDRRDIDMPEPIYSVRLSRAGTTTGNDASDAPRVLSELSTKAGRAEEHETTRDQTAEQIVDQAEDTEETNLLSASATRE